MEEVLVLGAGLSGLRTALSFRMKGAQVKIIDLNGVHEFTPGTVEILRERVKRSKLEENIEEVIRGTGIELCVEKVEDIRPEKFEVVTSRTIHEYDKLVVALGSEINRKGFDISDAEHVYSLSGASDLRDRLEKGSQVAIIGAGYVGLEVMGELSEMDLDITLIDSNSRPVTHINNAVSEIALKYMDRKDVEFKGERELENISGTELKFKDAENLEPDILVWCNGVRPSRAVRESFELGEKGIPVDSSPKKMCHSFPALNYENIFVTGDCANIYWRINKHDSISMGKTAIYNAGGKGYESRIFRYLKDIIRHKYFISLKLKIRILRLKNSLDLI